MMPAVRGDAMRGLAVFISDIRNCKSKEAEVKRINKELANIRSKFKGDKTLDGYQKKKYVCKLLFIFLLGHDIDFGHMEAVNLLSSNKYTEKQIGYLFISVLISSNSDLINLINQSIKNDLAARNPVHVSLALQCIANVGSKVRNKNSQKLVEKIGQIEVEINQCQTAVLSRILISGYGWGLWSWHPQTLGVRWYSRRGQTIRRSLPAQAVPHRPQHNSQRWMDLAHHSSAQWSAYGRGHRRLLAHWRPCEKEPRGIQRLRGPGRFQVISHCYFELHGLPRLHLLLCSRTLVVRQVIETSAELPTSWWSWSAGASEWVPGNDLEQGTRTAKVQESPTFQCQEQCSFRSNLSHHPQR